MKLIFTTAVFLLSITTTITLAKTTTEITCPNMIQRRKCRDAISQNKTPLDLRLFIVSKVDSDAILFANGESSDSKNCADAATQFSKIAECAKCSPKLKDGKTKCSKFD